MAVVQVWVSPATGGSIHLQEGGTISQTWIEQVAGDLLVLGGTAGFGTVNASTGVQPISGFFMGGIAGNNHIEGGTVGGLAAGGTTNVTFGNAFGAGVVPSVTVGTNAPSGHARANPANNTGVTIVNDSSDSGITIQWHALGAD